LWRPSEEIAGYDSYGRPYFRLYWKGKRDVRFDPNTRWDRFKMLSLKYGRTYRDVGGEYDTIVYDVAIRVMDAIDYGDVEYFKEHPTFKWKDSRTRKGPLTEEWLTEGWSNDWSWIARPKIRRRHPVAKKIAKKVAKPTLVKGADKKVAKVEKPAKAEKKAAAPKSTRNTGKTTGLKIAAYQDQLMQKNFKAKLTDEQLAAAMCAEFPNAITYTVNHVRGIRSQWNNGARASQEGVAPDKPLPEYGEDGSVVERRRGPAPSEKKASGKKVKAGKKAKPEPEEEEEEDEEEDEEEEEEDDEE
jgi:hypothetical protein